jgi:hypothetical protein
MHFYASLLRFYASDAFFRISYIALDAFLSISDESNWPKDLEI